LTTFPMYPTAFPLRLKRPWASGLPMFNGRLIVDQKTGIHCKNSFQSFLLTIFSLYVQAGGVMSLLVILLSCGFEMEAEGPSL
jgi:hypothetical protein